MNDIERSSNFILRHSTYGKFGGVCYINYNFQNNELKRYLFAIFTNLNLNNIRIETDDISIDVNKEDYSSIGKGMVVRVFERWNLEQDVTVTLEDYPDLNFYLDKSCFNESNELDMSNALEFIFKKVCVKFNIMI